MPIYDHFLSMTGMHLQESAIRRMGTALAGAADLVSFAPGYPDPTLFPYEALDAIAHGLLGGRQGSALQYGPTRGYPALIDALIGVLATRGIEAVEDEILVTTGSQQGVELAARVLLDPGDVVLVEEPTFTGGISSFRNVQARVVGVAQTDSGLDPEALDTTWVREHDAGHRIKLLYVIPNFQNPTGRLLPLSARREILAWAERRDVLVLEDDPYGSLYFEGDATPADTRPLKADDAAGRVLYLGSFSKTLAPGFRVGWMTAPAPLVERFETAKQSADLASGSLDQRIVERAIRDGLIDRMAPALRAAYRRKRDAMEQALRVHVPDRLSWRSPRGGFFIWATLAGGVPDVELLDRARAHGLIFVVGSAFHVDGRGHDTIRLSFSALAPDAIDEGARRLAKAFASGRP